MNASAGGEEYPTLAGSSAALYDDRDDVVALAPASGRRPTHKVSEKSLLIVLPREKT